MLVLQGLDVNNLLAGETSTNTPLMMKILVQGYVIEVHTALKSMFPQELLIK